MASKNDNDEFRNRQEERHLFTRRTMLAGAGVLGMMGLLGARLGQLQITGHQHYTTMSQANRVSLSPIQPNRGLIHDRNGVILAENIPTFQIIITPEQVDDLDATINGLADVIPLSDSEIQRFHELRGRSRSFEPIPLKFRLSEQDVAAFAANRHRFPGVEVEARLTRHYPHGSHAVHALGYVGRISEQDLRRIDASRYRGSTHMGKAGAELQFEERLHGHSGIERVETNAQGRMLQALDRTDPNPGEDIYLTIDSRLQQVAENALGDFSGSVVAIDTQTGQILALASKPMFDPNLFVNGIDSTAFQELQQDIDQPMFNRAVRGQYPPGSTIKPFMAMAGLHNGTITPQRETNCPGYYTIEDVDDRWRCWQRLGHGDMNLHSSLAESCDVFFYDLGYRLGIDNMHSFLAQFGFGDPTESGIPGERPGILPSREWKRRARGEAWFHGETVITSIGQGFFLSTPLQLAHATSILANRGIVRPPHLLRATRDASSGRSKEFEPPEASRLTVDDETYWDEVINGMVAVVHGQRGTARQLGEGLSYELAGKSGTAQVFSLGEDQEYDPEEVEYRLRSHALFNAFAPARNPRIAVAAIVEHGGSGGAVAGPVARAVIDAYLEGEGEAQDA